MRPSLLRAFGEVLACYAASRQALAANGKGELDDDALAVRLRHIEQRMAVLRGAHGSLGALVSWLGRPVGLPRPVGLLLLLAAASLLVRCLGAVG